MNVAEKYSLWGRACFGSGGDGGDGGGDDIAGGYGQDAMIGSAVVDDLGYADYGESTASEADADDSGDTSPGEAGDAAGFGMGFTDERGNLAIPGPTPDNPKGTYSFSPTDVDALTPNQTLATQIAPGLGRHGPTYGDALLAGISAATGVGGIGTIGAIANAFGATPGNDIDAYGSPIGSVGTTGFGDGGSQGVGGGDESGATGFMAGGYGVAQPSPTVSRLMQQGQIPSVSYNPRFNYQWGGLMHPQLEPTAPLNTNTWSTPYDWRWRT